MSNPLKIGSLVYATDSGLGVLAKSFFDNGIITDPLVVGHAHYQTHREWYPSYPSARVGSVQLLKLAKTLCDYVDVMLFFETPFIWQLLDYCRFKKVKTVLMPMYECMPKVLPSEPDYFLCPSLLDFQYYPERSEFIPVPVDTKSIKWKQRDVCHTFVHNAGHIGLNNRNGTGELIDSLKYSKAPFKLILRSQKPLPWGVDDPRVDLRIGTVPFDKLYDEGDVFVFPEKHNGLSLPMQEAFASGMPVMCGERFPMPTWLPAGPMIPVDHYETTSISGRCNEFKSAVITPKDIAYTMGYWYGEDISDYSINGRTWGQKNSWESLNPRYMEFFDRVMSDRVGK